MRSRLAVTALGAALLAAIAFVSFVAPADAADDPQPDTHGPDMISFQLPVNDGQRFTPNAHNIARPADSAGPLLLFLPATRAIPSDYRAFLSTAHAAGYHVLALDYWNRGKSVVKTCAGIPDCYGAVQRNRFDGTDPNQWSAIAPSDSILNRLRVSLAYLQRTDPGGGWSRYATDGHIHWNDIVVAGHSQGGGQSAFIAHSHLVHGAIMFSSPVQSDNGVPAAWMKHRGHTPASRMYGFVDSNDMYYQNVVGSWRVMGLGEPTMTDSSLPFRKTHTLVSDRSFTSPDAAHLGTVIDATPRETDGSPVFQPIWRWMLDQLNKPTGNS